MVNRKAVAGTAAVLAAALLTAHWVHNPPRLSDTEIAESLPAGFAADAARGEILYHIGGCGNCHARSGDGGLPSGGDPLETAVGAFYPPNITPDAETGIGSWTAAGFVNALRKGIGPDGRHYYPAFPYTSFATAANADLLHLKAYLDSIKPVRRASPPHDVGFPFNIRPVLAFWKLAQHRERVFEPDPNRSPQWNRGAYFVNGLGHCGVCHTPRNIAMAESRSERFAGAPPLKEGENAAPGIAGLSQDEILNAFSEWSGAIDEESSMFLVTQAFSNHVPYEFHEAIALYLSSLEPVR